MTVFRDSRWAMAVVLIAAFTTAALAAQEANAQSSRVKQAPHAAAPEPAKPTEPQQPPSPGEAAAPAPVPEVGAIGEFQPVLHAQEAKITNCMDTIVAESASVIDSAHTAISSRATAAPDDNLFVSIIGLSYANKAAPNGAAVIVAAPSAANKCKGETVQVYPLARSCSAVQASLIKEGRTLAVLRALPVVEAKTGTRNLLIPTTGGGCVVVAVTVRQ